MAETQSHDPRQHARNIQAELDSLVHHLRNDVGKVDDPQAEALFETTAEVLQGLSQAYQHYAHKSEQAWH